PEGTGALCLTQRYLAAGTGLWEAACRRLMDAACQANRIVVLRGQAPSHSLFLAANLRRVRK
ncbi:hypothetical protein, partial [Pseudomonas viridiflava]|uniref:hypothetical protein n=1 Tax=Pseudomonas viridiflava TaxID=33069 RepID=UPI00197E22CD